jgi:hypothetical protein
METTRECCGGAMSVEKGLSRSGRPQIVLLCPQCQLRVVQIPVHIPQQRTGTHDDYDETSPARYLRHRKAVALKRPW